MELSDLGGERERGSFGRIRGSGNKHARRASNEREDHTLPLPGYGHTWIDGGTYISSMEWIRQGCHLETLATI